MVEEGQRVGERCAFVCVHRGVTLVVSWMSSAPQETDIGIDGWLSVSGSWVVVMWLWAGPWLFFSITADLVAKDSEAVWRSLCFCASAGSVCVCVCTLIQKVCLVL